MYNPNNPHFDPSVAAAYQAKQDSDHLNLLSIFQYVYGALLAVGGFGGIFYVMMGSMFSSPSMFPAGTPPGQQPPREFGQMFVLMGAFFMVVAWTISALAILAGRNLSGRKGYNQVFVAAIIECLQMPLGTILGVCTLVVMNRPTVKGLLQGAPAYTPQDGWPPPPGY